MLLTDITIIRISISCAIYVLSMCYLCAIYVLSMCYRCAIYVLFIITILDVYTSVFSHCTPPLPLKQFLKTFNYRFILVYYMAD